MKVIAEINLKQNYGVPIIFTMKAMLFDTPTLLRSFRTLQSYAMLFDGVSCWYIGVNPNIRPYHLLMALHNFGVVVDRSLPLAAYLTGKSPLDLEGQGQSTPQRVGALSKICRFFGPNLMILAETCDELLRVRKSWGTHRHT